MTRVPLIVARDTDTNFPTIACSSASSSGRIRRNASSIRLPSVRKKNMAYSMMNR